MIPLCVTFHDVNDAYCELMTHAARFSELENTRNGPALVFQTPVLIEHCVPYRRVLFDPIRDANPFFHYMEALWMLAGANEVKFLAQFTENINNYSDDGRTLNGAYGYRWRNHWDNDQIEEVIQMLRKTPNTRRAVLSMWDPAYDLNVESKDLPCNTNIYFQMRQNALDMTVCNRSNDLVWGCLGANMVHMAVLHEYIATAIERPTGSYYQFTNNLHIYEDWIKRYGKFPIHWYQDHPGLRRWVFSPDTLHTEEAMDFVENELETDELYRSRIIRDNAEPMLRAHRAYKEGDVYMANHYADKIYDDDWRVACLDWLGRRKDGS